MEGIREESEKEKKQKAALDYSVIDESLSIEKTKKKKKKKKKSMGKDSFDGHTEVMEKHKKKKKSKEIMVDSEAKDSTVNKKVENETANEKDEMSREDSSKRKKKKKKGKTKVSDLEAENEDQRDEMPVEDIDGSSDDTSKKKKRKKQKNKFGADQSMENSDEEVKKKRKKKQNTMESERDAKKKKQDESKNSEYETPSSSKSAKKVKFSDQVDVFPLSDGEDSEDECEKEREEKGKLVRGKRFSKEEDELVKAAVQRYINVHGLGEEGLSMVMKCKSNPKVRNCWKEIAAALPWRTRDSVYYRAHILFEGDSERSWTPEQLELVKSFAEKHGSDWKTIGEAIGKHRWHVKDAWRRIKFPSMNKVKWSREEYQTLFDLVNVDLRTKALQEKNSKHGMLRDNIPWTAISDKLGTRNHSVCCVKWYNQLTSPMVAEGIWDNADDYRLLAELQKLDSACIEDVDWDSLLENRSGELCRKRWNQMVLHIGVPGSKSFSDQVEILADRYCPELAEDREAFDSRPYDDVDDDDDDDGDDDDDDL